MKTLVAVAAAFALAASADAAAAYVAVVGKAIQIPSSSDAAPPGDLEAVIETAIRDVLEHAVAFTPTVASIQDARIIGDRLYLFIFLFPSIDIPVIAVAWPFTDGGWNLADLPKL